MHLEGWIFIIGSWVLILSLFSYCMFKTLTAKDDNADDTKDLD